MKFIKLLIACSIMCTFTFPFTVEAQWSPLTIPNSTGSMKSVYFKNANEGFVAGSEHIRHTLNGGATWDTVSYGIYWAYLGGCTVENIHFVSATEGIASGYNFWDNCEIVFKTYDGGNTWTDIKWGNTQAAFGTYLHDMAFVNSTSGICVGDLGHIITTNDAGDIWSYNNSGTSNDLYGVYFIGNNGWVVGDEIILKTTNFGNNWSSQSFPGEYFQDVYFTSANVGYAAGNHIYKTTDGGTTWNQVPTSYTNLSCNDVWAANADTIYIANSGNILKSNDAGATWFAQQTAPTGKNYLGVWFLNPNFGIATTYNGEVYKTTTGGDPVQQNDAGITIIPQLPYGSCQGVYPMQVTLKNYGQANLTQAKIDWTVKGVAQTPYIWNGNIPHDSSELITIGNYNFGNGNHPIKVYTTQANNVSEYIHDNDTAITWYDFQRLNGNYTVGGVSPDFGDVNMAIAALNSFGTCGNVKFKIRNGTYSVTNVINDYYKTNSSDSVTFSSENGDSSLAIVNTGATYLTINKSSDITFSKITLQGTNGAVIYLADSASNLTITNCYLNGAINSGAVIQMGGKALTNFKLLNSRISYGAFGMQLLPNSGQLNDGVTISNCIFENGKTNGVAITNTKNLTISNNQFSGLTGFSFQGITLTFCSNGFLISGNKIITERSAALMNFSNCRDTAGSEGVIANNFLSVTGTTALTSGISISGCSYLNFYYNTINTMANKVVSLSFADTLYQPQLTLVNNILNNRAAGLVFGVTVPNYATPAYYTSIIKSISNNGYNYTATNASGYPNLFFDLGSFSDWKILFPSENSSLITDPQFISTNDFHIYPNTTNYLLNKAGTPIAGITTDLDGNNRNATKPDIGADEFATSALDAGALRFEKPTSLCGGANDLYIRIVNYGTTTLTAATLNYSVNGIAQASVAWSGSLTTGDSSAFQLLGNYVFTNGNSYTVKAWTTNPNGSTDAVAINDTITAIITAKGLSGVYTIGGVAPSYTTIAAAVADLNLNGVCGATTFNIRAGTYIEAVTINAIHGASALNNITFQSENGDSASVIIYNSASVFTFDSASYINLHQLTFGTGTNTTKGNLNLKNNAHHISITNNAFNNGNFIAGISNDIKNTSDLLVDRNYFYQCAGAVMFNSTSYANISHGNILSNNIVDQTFTSAFYIAKANDIQIVNNKITGALFGSNSTAMIDVRNCTGKATIKSNQIIFKNNLFGISFTNNTGHFYDKSVIANNMVSMKGNYSYGCFFFQNSKYIQCSFNSGFLDSTNMAYNGIFYGGTDMDVRNNCFYNKAGGYVMDGIAGNTNINSDYNNLYTTGALYFEANVSPNNLQGWQALTGQELHSLNVIPSFVSSTDLHLLNDYNLDAAANPNANVTTDFDGDMRNATTPDIGADEIIITPVANDAGVRTIVNPGLICSGNQTVQVILKNYGSNNLTSATIHWSVNGVAQTDYAWSGNLSSISLSSPITIGTYNFNAPDSFNIVAWTSNPNGTADNISVNDSAKLNEARTRLNGTYTIGGTNADYASFDDATLALKSYGVCGPVIFNVRNGSYNGPQNVINTITGSSLTNTITFQSEAGDSTQVTINNGAFSDPTFNLMAADYFTFKQLTINSGGSADYPVSLDNGSDYCKILNCIINGRLSVYLYCNHNLISNNVVNNQIFLSSNSGTPGMGNTVSGNTIINNVGIVSQFEDSLLIEKNTIINPQTYVAGNNSGINLLANGSHFKCIKNRISGNFSAGLYLSQDGLIGDTGIVANNIVVGGNAGGGSVYLGGEYVKFVYNTFYGQPNLNVISAQNASMPFDRGLVIMNNQFITYGYNWAYYWGNVGSSYSFTDYNNYYTTGPDLISNGISTQYQSIAAFHATYPSLDMHSTDVDPQFPNASFLYPANPAAQGTGIPIAGVTDDINDSLRSTTNPNMGAMEVPPVVVHDSLKKDIIVTLLNDTVVIGNNTISVQVNNERPFTTDSALVIYEGVIDTLYFSYSVNGAPTVNETWTGSLALYDSITFNFAQQYNVPKGKLYHVHVEVQMPGKFTVMDYTNDTLAKDLMTPMFGTYTVNGTNPDFANLYEAIFSLYDVPLSGNVIFNSRAGLDSMYSLNNMYHPYFITFQSESGNAADVQIIFSNINNSSKINFKNLTIYPKTNTDYLYNYKGAELIGSQFSIDSCIIHGLNDPLYRDGITFVNTDSLSVTNCHFINLDNGITLSDYQWFGSDYFYGNNYIINNTFDSVTNCIHLLGQLSGDTTIVSKNVMNNPAIGVDFNPDSYCVRFIMEKNKITGATTNSFNSGGLFSFVTSEFNMKNNMLGGNVHLAYFDNNSVDFNYNSILGSLIIDDSRNVHFHNNSVYTTAAYPALNFSQSAFGTTVYDCDNNNYYAPNSPNLAYVFINGIGGGGAFSIADITTITGGENNSVSANPMYASANDLHSNSPVLNNAGTPIANITTDIDDELRSATTPDIGCDEFSINDSLVWPGDCNYDGTTNNYDLLSIGLYFNQTGTTRAAASNSWVGQASSNWGTLQYCGWDKKHADCNGDGIISWSDTTAIKLNWGQTHPFKAHPLPYVNTQPDLHFVSSASAYKPGDTVDVEIWSGDISNPVAALYGISFDVAFPTNMVKAGSMSLSFNPSWIGIENVTAITTSNITTTAAGSISRITGTDTSGYGAFAKLHFIVEPTLTSVADFTLSFSNYLAVTAGGNLVQFNTVSDTLTIDPTLSIEENASQNFFTLYPNPATDETVITYNLQSSSQIKIELYNSIGEKISLLKDEKQSVGNHKQKINFNTNKFSKGIYFVKMMVDGKTYARKLMVE